MNDRVVFVNGVEQNIDDIPFSNYKKKPVIVRAYMMPVDFEVETLEGIMKGNSGDYLIEGINKELYPCKPDIFKKTYRTII